MKGLPVAGLVEAGEVDLLAAPSMGTVLTF